VASFARFSGVCAAAMASFARFCPDTLTGWSAILAGLASFARLLPSSHEPSDRLPFWRDWLRLLVFHEPSQPIRPPFWQDWLRLHRFRGRAETRHRPMQPAQFIQINFGFVSQILREPAPTLQDQMIDKSVPD
jgi:hypothetical protein